MIKLFEEKETEFATNGLGGLSDAISCVVKEELNGEYELEMVYPVNGIHYSDICLRRIILAKPNTYTRPQPFRIYSMSKPINGQVTIYAEHLSYDLTGIPFNPVSPYYVNNAAQAFEYMKNNAVVPCDFIFTTDVTTEREMSLPVPRSIRSVMGKDDNSILSWYGGEYEFDRFEIKLHHRRGANRGVTIRYGKNMTDLKQDENCSELYTAIYPYYYKEDDGLQYLSDKIVKAEGDFGYTRILPVDLTSEFDEMPTEDVLRKKAVEYINENGVGVPKVSLTVSFLAIENPEVSSLTDVRLGDTVTVKFLKLGVDSTATCIATEFDVLTGRYQSVELGEKEKTIVDTISEMK